MTPDQIPNEELLQILEQIKRLKADNERLQSESRIASQQASGTLFELQRVREINKQLSADLETHLDTEFQEQIKELDSEIEAFAAERDGLVEKITSLENCLSEATSQISVLKLHIAELESGSGGSPEVRALFDSIKRALQE